MRMMSTKVRGDEPSDAKLRFAKIYRIDFGRSDLSVWIFSMSYASLSFTDLKGTNLEGAGMGSKSQPL